MGRILKPGAGGVCRKIASPGVSRGDGLETSVPGIDFAVLEHINVAISDIGGVFWK